jgi:hypothetical protein
VQAGHRNECLLKRFDNLHDDRHWFQADDKRLFRSGGSAGFRQQARPIFNDESRKLLASVRGERFVVVVRGPNPTRVTQASEIGKRVARFS